MADTNAPRYKLTVSRVTGVLLYAQRETLVLHGTLDELEAQYRRVKSHNLLFGWWGFPLGLAWNVISLQANARAYKELHALAA